MIFRPLKDLKVELHAELAKRPYAWDEEPIFFQHANGTYGFSTYSRQQNVWGGRGIKYGRICYWCRLDYSRNIDDLVMDILRLIKHPRLTP
jgi:hypothetical protein